MQKIVKILHNNDMVEFKTWYLWKIVQCDNNLPHPKCAFTLHLARIFILVYHMPSNMLFENMQVMFTKFASFHIP
jgi:hypothetical protein